MLVVSILLALIATPLIARAVAMNRGAFNGAYTDNDGALASIIASLAAAATLAVGIFVVVPSLGVETVTAVAVVGLSVLWAVLIGRHARGRFWLRLASTIASSAATIAVGVFVVVPRLSVESVTAVVMVGLSMLWAVLIGLRAGARGRFWLKWLKRAAG